MLRRVLVASLAVAGVWSAPVALEEERDLRAAANLAGLSLGLQAGQTGVGISFSIGPDGKTSTITTSAKTTATSSHTRTSSTTRSTSSESSVSSTSATSPSKTSSSTRSSTTTAASTSKSSSTSVTASKTTTRAVSAGTSTHTSSSSSAAQAASTGCASAPGDAPFSLSCSELSSVITFPDGNQHKPGGIVFLVHGTGSTGSETWNLGPYHQLLPSAGPGYDIAWFTSPTRSLGDAQITAEYIAYNIKALAAQSSTGKVFLVGHSQGNINIQWALEFWPSMRQYVTGFSSIAGDFHGTAEGPLLCTGQDLLQGGCEPGVLQQDVGSHYLAAQNAQGGSALVPTTSIYTLEDDIIQPEVVDPTSNLPGAVVTSIQAICGPLAVDDHFTMTVAAGAYYLTLNALSRGGQADLSQFNALTQCNYLSAKAIPNPFEDIPGLIRQAALDAIAVGVYEPKTPTEPLLMPYVCERGAASTYCKTS